MQHHFFAMISRMRYINRWGLMRNTFPENIMEHSLQVAMVAHALAVIRSRYYSENRPAVRPEQVAVLAIYHDASEILTGDLPTPVKYNNPQIRNAYHSVESMANERLLSLLPTDMTEEYRQVLAPDTSNIENEEAMRLVKMADRICAYLKCIEEEKAGNNEFKLAGQSILAKIQSSSMPEVKHFMRDFVPSFSLTLDELDGMTASVNDQRAEASINT